MGILWSRDKTRIVLKRQEIDAVLFDMDGVVTRTATIHAAAWKQVFDDFLSAKSTPGAFKPFDIDWDYLQYVDGKPRYDGVGSFLASRGISLPFGRPDDPPGTETVCGLGNRKDELFLQLLRSRPVDVYQSTVDLILALKDATIKTGVFSASRNAERVLARANVLALFDEKVDGVDADRLGLPGKPDPVTLLELAKRLGAQTTRSVVVEDAIAGVLAGRAGGFGLVVGVNRSAGKGTLLEKGAHLEVTDLSELSVEGIKPNIA